MSHGSEGKDTEKGTGVEHKHDKKLLLKSLAGGMTFFGAAFFLFYLRYGDLNFREQFESEY